MILTTDPQFFAVLLAEIARKEVAVFGFMEAPGKEDVFGVQQSRTKALGPWQILPDNWPDWAPKALGTDPAQAVGGKAIPPADWRPVPTPWRQWRVALWRAQVTLRRLGSVERVAAAWLAGEAAIRNAPQPAQWSAEALDYANKVVHAYPVSGGGTAPSLLGYPQITRETVLPELGYAPATYQDLEARVAELESALRAQEYATEEQRQRADAAVSHRDHIALSGGSLLASLRPFETVAAAADEFRRTL